MPVGPLRRTPHIIGGLTAADEEVILRLAADGTVPLSGVTAVALSKDNDDVRTYPGTSGASTREFAWTAAQTDAAIITVGASTQIIVTRLTVVIDEATTVGVGVRIGLAAATLPADPASGSTADGIVLSHPGIVPGGGITIGDGSAAIAVGAVGEDLRCTAEVPTGGKGKINVTWFEV